MLSVGYGHGCYTNLIKIRTSIHTPPSFCYVVTALNFFLGGNKNAVFRVDFLLFQEQVPRRRGASDQTMLWPVRGKVPRKKRLQLDSDLEKTPIPPRKLLKKHPKMLESHQVCI